MLEEIQAFLTDNSTMVIVAIVALVAIVGFVMFRRMNSSTQASFQTPFPTPSHDMEGMESMNSVCDMASGMCYPPEQMAQMAQMSPEQEQQQQQMMMQQQMMQQQMQQQQQQEQMQQQQEGGQEQ